MAKKKNGGGETITQLEAVRQALASGAESAEKAVNFIKNEFGISLKPQAFYTYKSQLKSKGSTTKSSGNLQAKKLPGGGIKVDDERRARGGADGGGIRAVKDVTALMDRYGVEKVKEIVEVFG